MPPSVSRALALATTLLSSGCAPRVEMPEGAQNVVLVTLDTTRADFFGAYGYPGDATPNFDALGADGVIYEAAVTTAAVTPVAHASILTGQYPFTHGLRVLSAGSGYRLPADAPTLATTLAAAGYETAAVHSAFPVSAHFGLEQGFQTFDSLESGLDGGASSETWDVTALQRRSDDTTDRVIDVLESLTPPFFLWIHYWDPHDVRQLPPWYFLWGLDERPDDLSKSSRERYAAEVSYVDDQFGRVVDWLRDRGLYDATAFAVTADHGEGLGEHDWLTHRLLYQEQVHVPLLLRLPEGPRGLRVAEQVRTIDIAPTLLAAVAAPALTEAEGAVLPGLPGGIDGHRLAYADQLNGYDLNASRMRKRPLDDFLYAVQDGEWKLIYRPSHPDDSELFHLSTDPDEAVNRYADAPEQRRRLLRALAALEPWRVEPFEGGGSGDDVQAMLEALGYQEAPAQAGPRWVWTCIDHGSVRAPDAGACERCGEVLIPRSAEVAP